MENLHSEFLLEFRKSIQNCDLEFSDLENSPTKKKRRKFGLYGRSDFPFPEKSILLRERLPATNEPLHVTCWVGTQRQAFG